MSHSTNGPLYNRAHPEAGEGGIIGGFGKLEIMGRMCHRSQSRVFGDRSSERLAMYVALPHFGPYEGGMMYNGRSQGGGGGLDSQSALRTDIWHFSVANLRCVADIRCKAGPFHAPVGFPLEPREVGLVANQNRTGSSWSGEIRLQIVEKGMCMGLQRPDRLSSSSISILIEVPSSRHQPPPLYPSRGYSISVGEDPG
ncbi:hypothetical protein C8R47DRAFT_1082686 [Mycena vitilis]|nr:hypothetical protein C8R47DRAFT_1082686 [Mycena vitilis]